MNLFLAEKKLHGNILLISTIKICFANRFNYYWKITINSIIKLQEISEGDRITSVCTRKVNQDYLENFFGSVRQQGENSLYPTLIQFSRAFRKLFFTHFLHAKSMNCSNDFDYLLLNIGNFNATHSSTD